MTAFFVDRLLRHSSRRQGHTQFIRIHELAPRHLKVQTVIGCSDSRIGRSPVGHVDTLKIPLFPQYADNQFAAFGSMYAVNRIIARHHSADSGFLYSFAKRRQVDFVKRPLINIGRNIMTVPLLIIAAKMLDRRHYTGRLHTFDIRHGRFGRQKGILAIIFVIASAKRRAIDIHPGAKHDMDTPCPGVLTERMAVIPGQFPVPCRGSRDTAWIHRTVSVVANPLGAIGHAYLRNPQPGNGPNKKTVVAADIGKFFFECHLRNQLNGTLFYFGCNRLPHRCA